MQVKLNMKIAEQQTTYMTLTYENNELNKTIDEISKKDLKGKSWGNRIQFQLEENLTNAKANLSILMNKNTILVDELTKLRLILRNFASGLVFLK